MSLALLRPATDHHAVARLFLKGLALVYFAAFVSIGVQIEGLAGPQGILPFQELLARGWALHGPWAWLQLPNLFWFDASGFALHGAAVLGALLALLLLAGRGPQRLVLALLFFLYLSLYHAAQTFTGFQWDFLLLEAGFLAIFLVGGPSRLTVFLYHWLLFRLRFLSGISKLASGDPDWHNFTALDHYFETQPLPHLGAWVAHQLPPPLLHAGVGFTFFAELVVPFFIFLPRPFRLFAAAVTAGMQVLIIATSNHNFFNLLTLLLCLFLLDDRALGRIVPAWWQASADAAVEAPSRTSRWTNAIAAILIVSLSVLNAWERLGGGELPRALQTVASLAPRYGIGNVYHVFPTMQVWRQELRISGSDDGVHWQPYVFRWKPDVPDRAPAFVVPHQPRLDWLMWFVPPQTPRFETWFERFLQGLAENRPAVTALLASNPFDGRAPPRYLRIDAYRYRFTSFAEHARTGHWWQVEYLGEFPDVPPRRP